MGLSYVLLLTGLSYVLLLTGLFYVPSLLYIWVHLMYTDYCGVLLLYKRWSLYREKHC